MVGKVLCGILSFTIPVGLSFASLIGYHPPTDREMTLEYQAHAAERAAEARRAAEQAAQEHARAAEADREREAYCRGLGPWRAEAERLERIARFEKLRHDYVQALFWERRADAIRAQAAPCQ